MGWGRTYCVSLPRLCALTSPLCAHEEYSFRLADVFMSCSLLPA